MKTTRRTFIQTMAAGGLAAGAVREGRGAEPFTRDVLALTRERRPDGPEALREPTGLTIHRIETFNRGGNLSFVKITADSGLEGIGQISTFDADISTEVLHRKIARYALGKDPADLDIIVDAAIEDNYKFPWSYVCRALSGVDTAVWDLLGKHYGKSVCELLGGRPRPFPVYGSSMSRTIAPADEAARLAKLRDELGYRAFKIRVGSVNGHDVDQWPGRTEEIIPTVRKGVGDDVALLADGNSCYTPPRAIEAGRLMEENHYIHFEEPCPYWELEWTARVAEALDMPVAGGEQDNDLAQWRRMIGMRAVDIVQPDILYIGGVARTLRVAKKAAEHGMVCVPHSANLAMVTLFSLHVMGAISNAGPHVEFSIEDTPWAENLFEPGFEVRDGKVQIPEGPGWGVRLNPEWLERAERRESAD